MKDKVDVLVSQNLTVSLVSVSKNFGESRNNLFSVYIYGFGSNRRLSIAYTIEQDDYTTATWSSNNSPRMDGWRSQSNS